MVVVASAVVAGWTTALPLASVVGTVDAGDRADRCRRRRAGLLQRALDVADALVLRRAEAVHGEAEQGEHGDTEGPDGPAAVQRAGRAARTAVVPAAPPRADRPLADRRLDEPVAQLGDRQREGHRQDELVDRQSDPGELADDLVDRPVEQVQAVAARADPVEHRIAEEPAEQAGRVGDGHDGHQRGDADPQEPAAEQPRVVADAEVDAWVGDRQLPHQQAHQRDAGDAEDVELAAAVAQRATQDGHRPPQHGQPGTEQDATGAGDRRQVQGVVGADAPAEQVPVAVPVGAARVGHVAAAVQHGHDGRDRQADAEQPQADLRQAMAGPAQDDDHDQGPEQVELLLHGQRPQVAQRGECAGRGVPLTDVDLVPVAAVEQPAEEVAAGAAHRVALEQRHVDGDAREHDDQGRQQAAGATQPELLEVDEPLALVLTDQQQGDEVAADHEEHLDAEEPAAEPLVVGVVHHHRHDSDGPQTVEPWKVGHTAELAALRTRRGEGGGSAIHSAPSIAHQVGDDTVISRRRAVLGTSAAI